MLRFNVWSRLVLFAICLFYSFLWDLRWAAALGISEAAFLLVYANLQGIVESWVRIGQSKGKKEQCGSARLDSRFSFGAAARAGAHRPRQPLPACGCPGAARAHHPVGKYRRKPGDHWADLRSGILCHLPLVDLAGAAWPGYCEGEQPCGRQNGNIFNPLSPLPS